MFKNILWFAIRIIIISQGKRTRSIVPVKSKHLFFKIRPRGAIYSVKYGELCEATKVNSIKAATGYFPLMSLVGKSWNELWWWWEGGRGEEDRTRVEVRNESHRINGAKLILSRRTTFFCFEESKSPIREKKIINNK